MNTISHVGESVIVESIGSLQKFYPATTEKLNYENRFQLLIACILMSQSEISEVNGITQKLFGLYSSMEDLAQASRIDLERLIKPSAFYRRKAKSIQLASQMLIQQFGGHMPEGLSDLLKLPGLARKGANMLLTESGQPAQGIAVDAHVWRVAERLGWVAGKSVESIERQLMKVVPRGHWEKVSHLLAEHSETTCLLNDPQCRSCPLIKMCDSAEL